MYLLRAGFLDGKKGLFSQRPTPITTFLKYYRFSEKIRILEIPSRVRKRNRLEKLIL